MAFVVSNGSLTSLRSANSSFIPHQIQIATDVYSEYSEIWRTQPSVRTVISFLARNIAQVGLHFYRRVSDTDRERVTDHPVARLFSRPNPTMRLTQYRLINGLVHDLGIYDNAFWLKVRLEDGVFAGVVPIPPDRVQPKGDNWLAPSVYRIRLGSGVFRDFPAAEVVHFHGYNPTDPRVGDSPMNALRAILMEEYEAIRNRQQMWRNGARVGGIIERPKDAPDWSPETRQRFSTSWRSSWTGGNAEAGGTAILEDGMTYKQIGLDPKAAQYIESRKLTREEAAAAYFIPPPMVGILDHATFSNIEHQHKSLYQDTLGPWLETIQQDIAEQIVPDFPDTEKIYPEFNIASKMRGSFEEQASAASTAAGAPWMTRNEIRARNNLPAVDGGDELVTPLNVLVGGLASPRDTDPTKSVAPKRVYGQRLKTLVAVPRDLGKLGQDLLAHLDAQGEEVLSALGVKAFPSVDQAWGDPGYRDQKLAAVIGSHAERLVRDAALTVLAGRFPDGWGLDRMSGWVQKATDTYARGINSSTRSLLLSAIVDPSGWQDRAKSILTGREKFAGLWEQRIITECSGFGGVDAAKAAGLSTKTWVSGDDVHTDLDGVSVDLAADFPISARWPGDMRAGRDQVEHCSCRLIFS